ncbi:redoxin domain-containing protein [Planctomycetota bacterium]|nr:redoxin domain-containing protein [Planctomycetota bacterium]
MKKYFVSSLAVFLMLGLAWFGLQTEVGADEISDNMKAKVGKRAPDFKLRDTVSGKLVSLDQFRDKKVVVMTFQSFNCPWDRYREEGGYQRVLNKLAKKYEPRDVQFIAINSNYNEPANEISVYAKESEIPYPVLKDSDNIVADEYGGRTTPHFYVINKEGILEYMGGFEKAPNTPEQCGNMNEQYLVPVLDAVLVNKMPPYKVTKSKGCSIKREKR